MIRDLPKTVPPAVLAAAGRAVDEINKSIPDRWRARETYLGDAFRRRANEERASAANEHLLDKAQALVDWGAMLQERLPVDRIDKRFRSPGGSFESLSVVKVEFTLAPDAGCAGGRIVTELELILTARDGLFRHYEWFDGHEMKGGGILNTASGLHMSLLPAALLRIHRIVAEGQCWPHIEASLARLVDMYKDR